MNDIDKKIQAALQGDDLGANASLSDDIVAAFQGRRRGLNVLTIVLHIAIFAAAVYTAFRAHHAETISTQLEWSFLTMIFLMMIMMLKLWFWLEIQSHRVLREIKRLELRLLDRPRSS